MSSTNKKRKIKPQTNNQKRLYHYTIHKLLIIFAYFIAFILGYSVLSLKEISGEFIKLLAGGAIFATFGSAIFSIGTLIERDLMEHIKLNIDILFKEIYKQKNPWRRWPFISRYRKHKINNNGEILTIELGNPVLVLNIDKTKILYIDTPTSLKDFFDLPLIKNIWSLFRFHKNAETRIVEQNSNKINKKSGLKPFEEYTAYLCLYNTWFSILRFRLTRYSIHFGIGLVITSIITVLLKTFSEFV